MTFTDRHRRAMALIADTFAPGNDAGIPSASAVGAPEMALHLAASGPRVADAQQLEKLLGLWDSPLFALAMFGTPRRFSAMSREQRERALVRLGDSSSPSKRALFQALKAGATLPYTLAVGEPLWQTMDFPGPLGAPANAPEPPLHAEHVTGPTTLDADVVIVGSGAGGGPAAAVLAAAGLSVIVLEAGEYYDDRDFDGDEARGIGQLYTNVGSADGQISLFEGRTLGGGTVVNYSTAFRTPDRVRAEWAALGAGQFASDEYTRALDAVWERLGATQDYSTPGRRDAVLERGAQALGWDAGTLWRNVDGCDQGTVCGRCGLGCALGAKKSTAKTWLRDAQDAGARILVGVQARRVTVAGGRATGVEAATADGIPVTVRARAVFVAAGSVQTPSLLLRSGLENPNIGAHLRLHPATAVLGLMDEEVLPWTGTMQARYVDRFADLDGEGYGAILETAPITPALGSAFVNWRSGAQYLARLAEWRNTVDVAVIVRDKGPGGRVRIGADGEPIVDYTVAPQDAEHMMQAMVGAARLVAAAGARRVRTTHQQDTVWEPASGGIEAFERDIRRQGVGPGRLGLVALHIMGSARMGGAAATSAVNPDGRTWEVDGLYVADGSSFPTASGVNPMVSIQAISYMTATRLAAALR
ncbi:GMC family oxidoreductase N-terminal domain-containing protein [Microbacterium sp. W1N]|uniref:GMC family oxidoreductase N-terminal domain-containing protein n=1 Tax=Microbacterium festucae TaxID=2977531 RepID=UPI0021BE240D|nr:GMC family oxidoreductase N-terminal domain-containing protein [Microbacterium festucae]MCT9820189.1 GMC family oxidoreductase N-terminal domain-containing protein [Microbacterium festucae]